MSMLASPAPDDWSELRFPVLASPKLDGVRAPNKDALAALRQANKNPKPPLGALVCELLTGTIFNVGTGFSAIQRKAFWLHRENIIGQTVSFKHKPRFPVFVGFRSPLDLDA